MEKLTISYEQIHQLCKHISEQIAEGNWKPDSIVAISGGGLIPARILRAFLQIPIYVVGLRRYDDTKKISDIPQMVQWFDRPEEQVAGKNILLVDEVDDTRVTLAHCSELILKHEPASLRIAVLTQKNKPKDAQLPAGVEQVYAGKEIEDIWVNHPWEAEDIATHNAQVDPNW